MKKIIAIVCLICCCIPGFSQEYGDYIIQHYGEDEGLPNNIVNSCLQSEDGFMWFGTWYGLTRFDGRHFQNYTTAFSKVSDQPPRKIETMVEDGCGNIWIKTVDWKLSVFFKQNERFEDVYDELKKYSHNLQIIKIQRFQNQVLLLTKDKNLLLASTSPEGKIKVMQIASSRGVVNTLNAQLKTDLVDVRNGYASFVGKDYKISAVKLKKGMKTDKGFWKTYFLKWQKAQDQLMASLPRTLFGRITDARVIHAGKRHGDFYLTESGELFSSKYKDLPKGKYLSMSYDAKNDVLWLATTNNGVVRIVFPPSQFRLIGLPLNKDNGVRSLYQFANGDVWVGTRSKNLYVLDATGKMKSCFSFDKYHIGSVYNIMRDSRGNIWLSTKGDGLVKAVPDASQSSGYRFEHYKHDASKPSSISGNNVYVTYEDSRHRIWTGTLDGGLNLIEENRGTTTFINKYSGLKNYPGYGLYMEVRNMAEDAHHRMWVGTIDGLMSFSTDFKRPSDIHFESYRKTEISTLANSDIYSLFADRKHNVWICTFGGGLAEITGVDEKTRLPKFRRIGAKEGLQDDVIISLLEDRKGQLWLGNARGLSVFDPATRRTRNFGRVNGFPNIKMEETVSMLNSNGEVWFGAKEGILAFNPSHLKSSISEYPVYIVNCEINNQDIRSFVERPVLEGSITYADKLVLRHNQNMFTLEFAALNYASQRQITYRYILEGFDHEWHYSGRNRIASYTNVPPGTYSFRVEAMDASNPEMHSSRTIEIKILPPWWATWWAYTIYSILFLILLYLAIRYARYQIRLKNDIYIQSKITEFKRQYEMEQEDARFLEQVNLIISENITAPDFDIDMIALKLGMSRSAFFKKLKSLTTQSPSDFVKDYKLRHAVEMLKNSDLSISDIAYQSGFSDVGYFGKCFHKKYGMSPRSFRTTASK